MFYPGSYSGLGAYNAAKDASDTANSAAADARAAQTSTELMQHDIDRLLMITEALWLFIKTQHNYTDEDLVKVITDIEMRDSRSPKHQPVTCPACGRMNSGKRPICIYCGKPIPDESVRAVILQSGGGEAHLTSRFWSAATCRRFQSADMSAPPSSGSRGWSPHRHQSPQTKTARTFVRAVSPVPPLAG